MRPSSLGGDVEDNDPVPGPYLIGRQTDARSLIHGIGHIIDKALDILANLFNRPGFFLEHQHQEIMFVCLKIAMILTSLDTVR